MVKTWTKVIVGGLRDSFKADGADLEVVNVTGDTVKVRITMGPSTCRECIMDPKGVQEIISNALEEQMGRKIDVEVEVFESQA